MAQARKNLPFIPEPPDDEIRVHPTFHYLDGNLALIDVIGPDGAVHLTHTALANLVQHPVDAHHRADELIFRGLTLVSNQVEIGYAPGVSLIAPESPQQSCG